MDIYEQLLQRAQNRKTAEPPPSVEEPEGFNWNRGMAVRNSPDLERVLALPRRAAYLGVDDPLVAKMTERLRRPTGTQTLRPIQARALHEIETVGGLLGPIGVGEGKTLVCLLAGTVLGVKRVVYLLPPALKDQVLNRDIPEYGKHWRLPSLRDVFSPGSTCELHVVSYSELSTASSADVLTKIKPQLIVCDEAHSLKRASAARTKRFQRYLKQNPGTKLVALSGTLVSKSLTDFAHLAKHSLGEGAPVPLSWPVIQEWAAALDPGQIVPADPGDLMRLCKRGENVREGFRRRLVETPGVVASSSTDGYGGSLTLHQRKVQVPKPVQQALADLRTTWCTPGGEEITDAIAFWRYSHQLSAGLYYRWIWPRQEPLEVRMEWLEARRDWHREVRSFLSKQARDGMDSPLLLARAAATGRWHSEAFPRWQAVHKSARPETEAVWVDTFLAEDAVAWGKKNTGIIWYEISALGEKIAQIGGFQLYGPGDEASAGIRGEDGSRTVVASRVAHGEGKNLQAFSAQLITTPSSSGKVWEQLLGRMHRQGQTSDEVTADLYLHTSELREAFDKAKEDARFVEQTLGAPQKLLKARTTFEGV